jgi:hypothetical protein
MSKSNNYEVSWLKSIAVIRQISSVVVKISSIVVKSQVSWLTLQRIQKNEKTTSHNPCLHRHCDCGFN